MQDRLIDIKNEAIAQILAAQNPSDLEAIRVEYLGKSHGKITLEIKKLPGLPQTQRAIVGRFANEVKQQIENALSLRRENLFQKQTNRENQKLLDPTFAGPQPLYGHLHPTTVVFREMNEIFKSLGFLIAEGPEIETDEFNYNRLNLPPDHPARDLQDTLYIKEPDVLLRTHTSSVEARILVSQKPPYRFVIPGKSYRFENTNASNNIMFTQYEGLAVGEGITLAHLKSTLLTFVRRFFGPNRKVRFRSKYYPQVEPGVGVDLDCQFCGQKGCTVCKYRGWIEMLGAGMVHPNMLRRGGLDPGKITGFAWGMGSDRIVMDRYKIPDIRALYNGEIGYLEQR